MSDGTCYIQYNSDTIYAFPDLSCTENSILPTFNTTTRQVYILSNGKYILTRSDNISYNSLYYTDYVSHISSELDRFAIDTNFLILPASLFVLAFFSIIYHWFIRLRG